MLFNPYKGRLEECFERFSTALPTFEEALLFHNWVLHHLCPWVHDNIEALAPLLSEINVRDKYGIDVDSFALRLARYLDDLARIESNSEANLEEFIANLGEKSKIEGGIDAIQHLNGGNNNGGDITRLLGYRDGNSEKTEVKFIHREIGNRK